MQITRIYCEPIGMLADDRQISPFEVIYDNGRWYWVTMAGDDPAHEPLPVDGCDTAAEAFADVLAQPNG